MTEAEKTTMTEAEKALWRATYGAAYAELYHRTVSPQIEASRLAHKAVEAVRALARVEPLTPSDYSLRAAMDVKG